jgi:hypothetical protein
MAINQWLGDKDTLLVDNYHLSIKAKTVSLIFTISFSVFASTFNRSKGSVFDGLRLNHQLSAVTVSPSNSST